MARRRESSSPDLDQLLFPFGQTGQNDSEEEFSQGNSTGLKQLAPSADSVGSNYSSGFRAPSFIANASEEPVELSPGEQKTSVHAGESSGGSANWLTPERISYLRLALVDGIGPRTFSFLVSRFGSPADVLRAPRSLLLQVPRIGPVLAERISSAPSEEQILSLLELCKSEGIGILSPHDTDYPQLLRHLSDPPLVLFVKGNLKPEDCLAVAIVGTRHPTPYGLKQAERLGAELAAAGFTIVSGLARGIDAAAHRGALRVGGRTIAVLASGLLRIYPPEHRALASKIQEQGALLSEALPNDPPVGQRFPKRNRIISGLAWGTIVVEAGDQSGALITAHHALEQGREVFAVPGRADDRTARGCNRLIRDGATMVMDAEDVLEVLRPIVCRSLSGPAGGVGLPQNVGAPAGRSSTEETAESTDSEKVLPAGGTRPMAELLQLSEAERRVLSAIREDPTCIDQIVQDTGLPSSEVLATISLLEVRRLIRRLGGNWVCLR